MADVGVDHGIPADLERESAGIPGDSDRSDVDRNASLAIRFRILRHARCDLPINRNVDDFLTVQLLRENDRTSLAPTPLDHPFPLQSPQMAHGSSLAGKFEVVLNIPSCRDNPLIPEIGFEKIENLLLTAGERVAHSV